MSDGDYFITKEIELDMGHRVPLHDSKCANPHGHRYRVVVEAHGPLGTDGSDTGMVIDFGHLKTIMMREIHDRFDHSFCVQDSDPLKELLLQGDDTWQINTVKFAPTAENLAWYWYHLIHKDIAARMPGCVVTEVTVWETPTSSATFYPSMEKRQEDLNGRNP